jgi:DNA (cytosine-5)-methyltransferase 1
MSEQETMTFGSLFTGIGGFDLGLEWAGMTSVWQVEIDARCNEVLAHHWPDVQRYGDVTDVGKRNLGPVDLICGGFPCQDVSVAGRRAGLAGERSGLWFQFHRVIEELGPEWVVIENVPGLLSSNKGHDLATILSGLAQLGYWWAYRVLDAQFFGVAQRRRRVFIVGCLTRGRAQEILFERESSAWDSAPSREKRSGITRDARDCLEGDSEKREVPFRVNAAESCAKKDHAMETDYARCLDSSGSFASAQGGTVVAHSLTVRHNSSEDGTGRGTPLVATFQETGMGWWKKSKTGGTLRERDSRDGASNAVVEAYNWQSGGDVRLGFGLPNLQANQVPAVGVRRLTPTECERLQGFSDDWTAVNGMSDSARYRMLGNAVAVPVAHWLGRRFKEET